MNVPGQGGASPSVPPRHLVGGGGFFPCHSQSCAAGKMLWDSQGRVWLRDASPFEAETSAAGW